MVCAIAARKQIGLIIMIKIGPRERDVRIPALTSRERPCGRVTRINSPFAVCAVLIRPARLS